MSLNGWTLQDNGIVPEWPGVGAKILIPAGATVPGVPPDPGLPPTTIVGTPASPITAAPEATTAPTTATTSAPTTTEAQGSACGTYTVEEGDYPGLVATKLDTTVGKLNSANSGTRGYSSFYVGLVINVPC
jgi:LysM repeat protein